MIKLLDYCGMKIVNFFIYIMAEINFSPFMGSNELAKLLNLTLRKGSCFNVF